MRIPVANIGNSKGFRIPQIILKECNINEEVELEVRDGNIILKPIRKRNFDLSFDNIPKMNDMEIQLLLRETDQITLGIALANAGAKIKEKVFKNMSDKAKDIIKKDIKRIEKMDAKELLVEMHRGYLGISLSKITPV